MADVDLRFPFTPNDTPKLRERIERDLRRVADAVATADPHLDALILTGGFSRGEGTARGGEPVNDYDLVAVRKRPGGGSKYRALHGELSRELGIEVDLMPVWRLRAPRVGAKLFWLDLKLGGRVIAGDPSALEAFPTLAPTDLPRREVARLLGNRSAGLLLALPAPGEPVDVEMSELQATKAVLAAMDAHLLAGGVYPATLRKRLELTRGHEDHALFDIAVAWKLGARERAPDDWWELAASCLLRAVEATGSRDVGDGVAEVVVHLAKAHRLARSPSREVRLRAWSLLERARFPDDPPDGLAWAQRKAELFSSRARTLQ